MHKTFYGQKINFTMMHINRIHVTLLNVSKLVKKGIKVHDACGVLCRIAYGSQWPSKVKTIDSEDSKTISPLI